MIPCVSSGEKGEKITDFVVEKETDYSQPSPMYNYMHLITFLFCFLTIF